MPEIESKKRAPDIIIADPRNSDAQCTSTTSHSSDPFFPRVFTYVSFAEPLRFPKNSQDSCCGFLR